MTKVHLHADIKRKRICASWNLSEGQHSCQNGEEMRLTVSRIPQSTTEEDGKERGKEYQHNWNYKLISNRAA